MFTDLWRANVHIRASAVLRWPMKYIRDGRTGAEQLFDVAADPRERNDLTVDAPETRGELSELLDAYEAFIEARRP